MEHVDVVIVGAGVSGLACAAELARAGRSVCVLERHPRAGHGHEHAQQRRDPRRHLLSGRIAEGAAVRRRRATGCTRSARAHGVPHARCGKLIVAADDGEVPALEALPRRGAANGVDGSGDGRSRLRRAREPHVRAPRALWSPDTGIVEAEALVHALLRTAPRRAPCFCPATRAGRRRAARRSAWSSSPSAKRIRARIVVNAAGLYADEVSAAARRRAVHDLPVPRANTRSCAPRSGRWSTASSTRCRT